MKPNPTLGILCILVCMIFSSALSFSNDLTCGTITGLKIYDGDTDSPSGLGFITEGQNININDLPTNYFLSIEVTPVIESVAIMLDGNTQSIENVVPYTWGNGNANWNGGLGSYLVEADAFLQDNGAGTLCDSFSVNFSIVDNNVVLPTAPTCGIGSFLWQNNVTLNKGVVGFDVRFIGGNTTSFLVPGPYPPEFSGAVNINVSEAISWDGYVGRTNTGNQPFEQWKVVFRNGGTTLYETPYTSDLATGVESDEWIGSLGTTHFFPSGVDEILLVHYEDPTYGTDVNAASPNSVLPSSICLDYSCNLVIAESITPNEACLTVPELASCNCNGKMQNLTLLYNGNNGDNVDVYESGGMSGLITSFTNVQNGQVLFVSAENLSGGDFESWTWFSVNGGSEVGIHTSCSQDVIGDTFGNFTVIGYTDGAGEVCNPIVCTGAIDLTVSGGIGPYTFLWSNGSTDEDLTALCEGDYSVTVTDANGCVFISTFTVTFLETPINATATFTSPDPCEPVILPTCNCICQDQIVSMTLQYSGTNGADVNVWNNSNHDILIASFTNVQNGDLLFADATGILPGDDFENTTYIDIVGGAEVNIHTSCSDDIGGLTYGDFTVIGFTDVPGNVCDVTNCVELCPCNGKMQNLTLQYVGNDGDNVDVYDANNLNNLIVSFSNVQNGDFLYVSAENLSGGDFESTTWFTVNGGTAISIHTSCSDDIQGLTFGNFLVVGYTDGAGDECNILSCNGVIDLTVTSGNGPFTFEWSNGSTSEDLTNACIGNHTVVVTDANGCTETFTFTLDCNTFDLSLTKIVTSVGPFVPGSDVTFSLGITNQGTIDATSITLTDYIPVGMSLNDGDWNLDGTYDYGFLGAGMTDTVDITLTIDANFNGTSLVNYAEISAATNASNSPDVDSTPNGDNTDDAGGAPDTPSDDAVDGDGSGNPGDADAATDEDDHDPASINVEQLVSLGSTVFADINNNGSQDPGEPGILGVVLDLWSTGPDGVKGGGDDVFVSTETTDANGEYWFENLPPGNYYVKILTPDSTYPTSSTDLPSSGDPNNDTDGDDNGVQSGGTGTMVMSNVITLTPGGEPTSEPGSGGNQDAADDDNGNMTLDFGFVPTFDLALIKTTTSGGPFTPGSDVTFAITVTNQGTMDATGIILKDYIPTGMSLNDGTWNPDGTYNLGNLAAGTSTTVTITIQIDANYNGTSLVNSAEIMVADNAGGLPDVDSTPNGDNTDDAGGAPDTPSDDAVDGDGSGNPGDGDATTDEDDHDPASINVEQLVSLGSTVFADINNNGSQDPGEPGILGVVLDLWSTGPDGVKGGGDDVFVSTETTDANGEYWFENLPPGNYYVKILTPDSTYPTSSTDLPSSGDPNNDTDGDDNGVQSGGTGTMVMSNVITLTPGGEPTNEPGSGGNQDAADDDNGNMTLDFGFVPTFDLALIKTTTSGGPFTPGSDVTFTITVTNQGTMDAIGIILKDYIPTGMSLNDGTWNPDGTYNLGNLAAGTSTTVTITIQIDANYNGTSLVNSAEIMVADNAGGLPDVDSTPNGDNTDDAGGAPDTPSDDAVDGDGSGNPGDGDATTDEDDHDPASINVEQLVSLGSTVFADDNDNGTQDPGELGIPNVDVELWNVGPDGQKGGGDDIFQGTQTTNADGEFWFEGIPPGKYYVVIPTPDPNYLESSTDGSPPADPDLNADGDDNGLQSGGIGTMVMSDVIELTPGDEPTGGDESSPGGDQDDATDDDNGNMTLDFGFIPNFDLALTKQLTSVGPFISGGEVTFQIEVINQGAADATSVTLIDYAPVGTTNNDPDWNVDGTYDLGFLAAGTSTTVDVTLTLDLNLQATSLVNYAEIFAATNPAGSGDIDSTPNGDSTDDAGGAPDTPADDAVDGDGSGNPGDGVATTDEDDHDPASFTVCDIPAPIVICPNDQTLACNAATPAPDVSLVIVTNNTGNTTVTHVGDTEVINGCLKTVTRTYAATNACFAITTCTQVFTIPWDSEDPVVTCPPDATLDCNAEVPAPDPGLVSATDNCFIESYAWEGDVVSFDDCYKNVVRTYSATDACGNTGFCVQVFTIPWDFTAPVFDPYEFDVDVECDDLQFPVDLTASDNCDNDLDIVFNDIIFSGECGETIERTWTAMDDCGNISATVQFIHIIDTTLPVITCPVDLALPCNSPVPAPDVGSVIATDNCSDPTITHDGDIINTTGCQLFVFRTYSATDDCGNTTTCIQIITIPQDDEDPVLSCPPDITLACNADVPAPDTGLITATDNCSIESYAWEGDVETIDGCYKYVVRNYSATDACGNTGFCTQIFTIPWDFEPPVLTCPENAELPCNSDVPAPNTQLVSATDNCGVDFYTWEGDVVVIDGCWKFVTRTYSATDFCGNIGFCSHIFTIPWDFDPPVITCPADLVLPCNAAIPAPDVNSVFVTDNCSIQDVFHLGDDIVVVGCFLVVTRTYGATDACGNIGTCEQIITVPIDNEPPVVICPPDVTLPCNSAFPDPDPSLVSATDNCGIDSVYWVVDNLALGTCGSFIDRIYAAVDFCGNIATCTQNISVPIDSSPPLVICPADATLECNADAPAPNTQLVSATDGCSGFLFAHEGDVETIDGCVKTVVRTYSATDDCGNTGFCSQTFTIPWDTTPPVLICPFDVTLYPDSNCVSYLSDTVVTAFDNCGAVNLVWSYINFDPGAPVVNIACGGGMPVLPGGAQMQSSVEVLATDICGNTSTCEIILEVFDTIPPIIIECPQDSLTLPCNADVPEPDILSVEFFDACNDIIVTWEGDDEVFFEDCVKTVVRTYSCQDQCDNTSYCIQNFTIPWDTVPPVITCPPNLTLACNSPIPDPDTGLVTATDNCGAPVVTHVSDTFGGDACTAIVTRTYKATDVCGNESFCTQLITIPLDFQGPVLTCPQDAFVDCEVGSIHPDDTGYPIWTDNCGGVSLTYIDGQTSGTCPYSFVRAWTAIDACGNTSTCTQIITVVDNSAPQILNPPTALTVECNEGYPPYVPIWADNCTVDLVETSISSISAFGCVQYIDETYFAEDNCGNVSSVSRSITIIDTQPPILQNPPVDVTIQCGDPVPTYTPIWVDECSNDVLELAISGTSIDGCTELQFFTFSAADSCGNAASVNWNITIIDSTPPTLTVADDVTVECGTALPLPGANATDLCGAATWTVSADVTDGCGDTFVMVRTYVATDACGNTTTDTQTLTVIDTTPPSLFVGADITIECDEDIPDLTAELDDSCGDVYLDVSEVITENGCLGNYMITRFYIATDDCGNVATDIQVITIVDTTPPLITCPPDVIINCDDDPNPLLTGSATATDNCSGIDITFSDGPILGNCPISFTRTWVAIDDCGNVSTCDQNIIQQDNSPPLILCPPDVTVDCNDGTDPLMTGEAVASDDCNNATVTHSDGPMIGTCPISFIRTWLATDDCGNQSTCDQLITLVDTSPPTIDAAADVTIECGDAVPAPAATVTDDCGIPTWTASPVVTPGCGETFIMVRTYTAVDNCGNTATDTQTITVVDTTDPQFISCPQSTVITLPPGVCTTDYTWTEPTFGSDCGTQTMVGPFTSPLIVVTQNGNGTATATFSVGITTIQYILTDACGNSTTCNFIVEVIDPTPPSIICPPDFIVFCGGNLHPDHTGYATFSDVCGGGVLTYADIGATPPPGALERWLRTWTVTDPFGNTISCVQDIVVQEAYKPIAICKNISAVLNNFEVTIPALVLNNGSFSCSGGNLEFFIDEEPVIYYVCEDVGSQMVELEVVDEFGNSAFCSANINVQDNSVPNVVCPNDTVVNVNCANSVIDIPLPVATDNCLETVVNDFNNTDDASGLYPIGTTTVTFSASDDAGNVGTCSFNVTVNEVPVPAPVNLTNTPHPDPTNPTSYTLAWDPVPGSIVCQIKGGPLGGGDFASLIVWGNEVSSKLISVAPLTPGTSYQWKVRCACATQPSIIVGPFSVYDFFTYPVPSPGNDGNGDEDYSTKKVEMKSSELAVSPNPSNGLFFLTTNLRDYRIEILDLTGKVVFSEANHNENQLDIDIRDFGSGFYFLTVSNTEAILTEKIVVEK